MRDRKRWTYVSRRLHLKPSLSPFFGTNLSLCIALWPFTRALLFWSVVEAFLAGRAPHRKHRVHSTYHRDSPAQQQQHHHNPRRITTAHSTTRPHECCLGAVPLSLLFSQKLCNELRGQQPPGPENHEDSKPPSVACRNSTSDIRPARGPFWRPNLEIVPKST